MASAGGRAVGLGCPVRARGSARRPRWRGARLRGLAPFLALPPTAARRAGGRSAWPRGGGAHRAGGEPQATIRRGPESGARSPRSQARSVKFEEAVLQLSKTMRDIDLVFGDGVATQKPP